MARDHACCGTSLSDSAVPPRPDVRHGHFTLCLCGGLCHSAIQHQWEVFLPVLFAIAGLYIFFREWLYSRPPEEEEMEENKEESSKDDDEA